MATGRNEDGTLTVETEAVIEADAERLRQVFQNLIKNAIEHAGEDPPVIVSAPELPDAYRFSVEDNGVGIPETTVSWCSNTATQRTRMGQGSACQSFRASLKRTAGRSQSLRAKWAVRGSISAGNQAIVALPV